MATSISTGLEQLNQADLSGLRRKLDTLRQDIKDAMQAQLEPSRKAETPVKTEIAQAASSIGISTEELLRALEWAKKRT